MNAHTGGFLPSATPEDVRIVLCIRDGVVSLVEGPNVASVMEWYRCNGPKAYQNVGYRELPVRYPGQLTAAELWYGCQIQRPFKAILLTDKGADSGNG